MKGNMAVLFIILIVNGGIVVYEKSVQADAAYMVNAVLTQMYTGLGVVGALLGELLGVLLRKCPHI